MRTLRQPRHGQFPVGENASDHAHAGSTARTDRAVAVGSLRSNVATLIENRFRFLVDAGPLQRTREVSLCLKVVAYLKGRAAGTLKGLRKDG